MVMYVFVICWGDFLVVVGVEIGKILVEGDVEVFEVIDFVVWYVD